VNKINQKQKSAVFRLLLLGCTVLHASFVLSLSISFDRASFNQYAAQFGNKTANLHELGRIAMALNQEQPGIKNRYEVPSFLGISHNEVVQYLTSVPFDEARSTYDYIRQEWEQFKQQQPRGATALTVDAQRTLENIRKSITHAFARNLFFVANEQRKEQLNKFLTTAAGRKALLMVRSTGREDSKELANAGGNESVSSVLPEIDAISKAMAEVVASYFSEKSIGQRLVAKDKKLFADPFMPVLLQIMIGERSGGSAQIPVSGVMFSQEAEGRTAGVTHIQATYGHNEGVVNGLVPVDTFYIGASRIVHLVVHIKHSRLVTAADFSKLVLTANPAEMQRKSCLDKDTLFDLQSCAKAIESYYGDPFDIEFVVQGNVIYLVQARPIEWQEIHPSYLKDDFVSRVAEADRQPVYVIGAGGGAVKIINDEQNIIMTDTLRKARDIFLKVENIDAIQAVIVSEMAPATSHEATTFRGAGKPVVYVPNINIIRSWIIAKQFPLLLDPQRELITIFKPSDEFGTPEDTLVRDAWFAHPIPKKTSLFSEFLTEPSKDEMKAVIQELKMQKFLKRDVKISQLIEMIKNDTADQALKALRSLLARVYSTIIQEEVEQREKKVRGEETNLQLIGLLKNIFKHAFSCAKEIKQALATWEQSPKTPRDRLGRLYPITFLQALVQQIPLREIVNDYSLGSLIKTEREEKLIVEELALAKKPLRAYIVQYAKASRYALTGEFNETWKEYLKQLTTVDDIKLQQDFARLMLNLSNLDLVPLWLNISFAQTEKEHKGDAVKIVNVLVDEYKQSEAFLNQLHQMKQQLEALNMANWEEPDKFKKQWGSFQKEILNYFTSQEFISSLEQAKTLGKNGALTVMQLLVSKFDIAIKALEGSGAYTDVAVKATNFKTMLDGYFALLKAWATMPSLSAIMQTLLDDRTFETLDEYLDAIFSIIDRAPMDISQLRPSPAFNVSAAALGSKAKWDRSIGEQTGNIPTLEDMFTLIHQNLLVVLATLSKQIGIGRIAVPSLVESLKKEAERLTSQLTGEKTRSASLVGINFDINKITYYYNLPLVYHSNTFQIIYNMQTETVDFAVQFLGEAQLFGEARWRFLASTVSLMSLVGNLSLTQIPEIDEQRGIMSFAWKIDCANAVPMVIRYVQILGEFSGVGLVKDEGELLEKIAEATDGEKQEQLNSLIDIIFRYIPQMPSLELFLGGVVRIKKYNIDDPILQKGFSSIGKDIKESILQEIETGMQNETQREKLKRYITIRKAVGIIDAISAEAIPEKYLDIISRIMRNLPLVIEEENVNDLINFAQRAIDYQNPGIRAAATVFFKSMTRSDKTRKQALELALSAAKKVSQDPAPIVRAASLLLYQGLIYNRFIEKEKKDKIMEEALAAAKKGIADKNINVYANAIQVFISLVGQEYALQEAEDIARKAIEHEDPKIRRNILPLLTTFVEKGRLLQEAENIDLKEMGYEALNLFINLAKKGRVHSRALEVALDAVYHEWWYVAIGLLDDLLSVRNIKVTAEQKNNIIKAFVYLLQEEEELELLGLFIKLTQEGKYLDIIIEVLNRSPKIRYLGHIRIILNNLKRHGKEEEAKKIEIEQKLLQ